MLTTNAAAIIIYSVTQRNKAAENHVVIEDEIKYDKEQRVVPMITQHRELE